MTIKEAQKAFKQLKAQGNTDEYILSGLYGMYVNDELSYEELEAFSNILGYELKEDFKNMTEKERREIGFTKKEK